LFEPLGGRRVDHPDRKADNLCELTDKGRGQARVAGERIRQLLGNKGTISVIVSPFERTQQTLYSLQQNLGNVAVRCVYIDPRVREQEFGNFQEDMKRHSADAAEVGRFYYRRPTGESGADVYDRAAAFWDSLLGLGLQPFEAFRPMRQVPPADEALLVVTHGLTMRLLLMRYFNWSPQTFDAVYNPGNCDSWVLVKNEEHRSYEIAPEQCSPPCMPWATRQVQLEMDGGTAADRTVNDYTIVDYLSLPQPRTSHPEKAMAQLIAGHKHELDFSRLDGPEERKKAIDEVKGRCTQTHVDKTAVSSINWWCGKISKEGVELRMDNNVTNRRASLRHIKKEMM